LNAALDNSLRIPNPPQTPPDSVLESLLAAAYDTPAEHRKAALSFALALARLNDEGLAGVASLSRGESRRLGIAKAVLERPFRVFEPVFVREIRKALEADRPGRALQVNLPVPSQVAPAAEYRYWGKKWWGLVGPEWIGSLPDVLHNWERRVDPLIASVICRGFHAHRYLDMGCGAGWQTRRFQMQMERQGVQPKGFGIDLQQDSIACARWLNSGVERLEFAVADFTDTSSLIQADAYDAVLCFFVLHDEPDLRALLSAAAYNVAPQGQCLAIILNPYWIESNRETTEVLHFPHREHGDEWVGTYGITRTGAEPLTVPYYHRSMDTYLNEFAIAGFDVQEILGVRTDREMKADVFVPSEFVGLKSRDMYQSIMFRAQKAHF
jgi:SAM-dependent methyltransferase